MFCDQCGNRVNDNSVFCGACGARLGQQPPSPAPGGEATVYAGYAMPVPPQPVQPQPMENLNRQPMEDLNRQPMEDLNRQPLESIPQEPAQTAEPAQPQWSYESPAQPQYDYVQPQWSNPAPTQPEQPWSYVPEQPKKKPIKKGKLFAGIATGVLAVGLIAAALIFLFVFNTPEYKVMTALEQTGEELRTLVGEDTNIVELLDEVSEIDDEMHIELDVYGQAFAIDYSREDKLFSAEADIMGYSGQIAANEDMLAISIPTLLEDAYGVPLKDFGKELCEWDLIADEIPYEMREQLESMSLNLFADTSWEAFTNTEAYKTFADSLVIEEVDHKIPNSDAETVYCVHVEMVDFINMYTNYMKFCMEPIFGEEFADLYMGESYADEMSDAMDGAALDLYLGMNDDDCIVAVLASALENDEVIGEIAILLNGEDNPWECIELYEDSRLVGTVRIVANKGGFSIYADDYCILEVKSDRIIIAPEEYDSFTIYYEVTDDGCEFTCTIDGVPVSLLISDECQATMISGDVYNIFDMDMDDIMALAEELEYLFG